MERIAVYLSFFGGALAILSHHVQIYPHMSNVQSINLASCDLALPDNISGTLKVTSPDDYSK